MPLWLAVFILAAFLALGVSAVNHTDFWHNMRSGAIGAVLSALLTAAVSHATVGEVIEKVKPAEPQSVSILDSLDVAKFRDPPAPAPIDSEALASMAAQQPAADPPPPAAEPEPRPQPTSPEPTARQEPARAASRWLGAGTAIVVASNDSVCLESAVGTRFTGTVQQDVWGSGGVVVGAGATVTFAVSSGDGQLWLNPESLTSRGETYGLRARVSQADLKEVGERGHGRRRALATGLGALLGGVVAHEAGADNKTSAAAAVAAGAAANVLTRPGKLHCITSGGAMTVQLDAPLEVAIGS